MFERFTERAREVVVLAQDEARRNGNKEVGRPHILAGLVREEEGVAAGVIRDLVDWWPSGELLEEIRAGYPAGGEPKDGYSPGPAFTPEAKQTLQEALRNALSLGHNYIGTEHLLLGLASRGPDIIPPGSFSWQQVRDAVVAACSRQTDALSPGPADIDGEIDRAAALLKELVAAGRQASITAFGAGPGRSLRMNILYEETHGWEELSQIAELAAGHGFLLEVAKGHGVTLRPVAEGDIRGRTLRDGSFVTTVSGPVTLGAP